MTHLDTRSRDVLMVLLQNQAPIAIKQIASQLGITPRMMRASLNTIQTWLEERDTELIRKQNYGIQIRTTPDKIVQLIKELSSQKEYYLYLSPGERIAVLNLMLLRGADQPLMPEEIEPVLGISRPTLFKDVEKVKKWLGRFSLTLTFKSNAGFQIQGSEANWREAMVHLYITKIGVLSLLNMGSPLVGPPDTKIGSTLNLLNTMLTDTMRLLDLKSAYRFVMQLEERLHRRFVDVAFVRLVCHLALAVSRSVKAKSVDLPMDEPVIPSENEVIAAIDLLLASESFSLNKSEVQFFFRQVLGANIQQPRIDMMQSHHTLSEQLETQEIVQHIVSDASLFLHPSLKVDQQLIRALAMHIQVAKNRLRYGLPINNPLQEAVEAQFPHVVSLVKKSVASLADQIYKTIPSDEIAYIAMHLGAAMERLRPYRGLKRKVWIVCGEGTATAWLLVARLQAEFPDIVVDEVTSVLKITQHPPLPSQVDVVLTTLPVEIPEVLTLEVSPLLTPKDQARIHAVLTSKSPRRPVGTSSSSDLGLSLSTLLSEDTIRLGVEVENWESVIDVVGSLLLNVHAISSRYIQAMKDVIYRYGPYVVFAPGTALLHARPGDGVNRICMSLVTLDPPIPFHHPHHDPVKRAFGMCVVDHHSHLKALAQLANLLHDEKRLSLIESSTSTAEVISILAQEP